MRARTKKNTKHQTSKNARFKQQETQKMQNHLIKFELDAVFSLNSLSKKSY